MEIKKIHCPICNGTGRNYSQTYGSIACLNCEGRGIVNFTREQQEIIDKLKVQKEKETLEKERKRNTELMLERQRQQTELILERQRQQKNELDRQNRLKEEARQKEKDNTMTMLVIILCAFGVFGMGTLIYINWHEILNFLIWMFAAVCVVALFIALAGGS